MNNQGWWRVTTTFPFLDENQSLMRTMEQKLCYSLLWAACLQWHSQPQLGACSGNQMPLIPPNHVLASHHSSSVFPAFLHHPPGLGFLPLPHKPDTLSPSSTYNHIIYLFSVISYCHSVLVRWKLNNLSCNPNVQWNSSQPQLTETGKGISFLTENLDWWAQSSLLNGHHVSLQKAEK